MNRNKKVSGKSFVAKASAASLALMMTATSVPATTLTAFAAETPEAAYAAEFEAFTEADKEATSNKYISLIGNKTIYTGDNKVKVIKSKKSGVTLKKITSSKTSVVKVDKKGVLTAVKPGTATITVTTNKGTVKCKITVKDAISFATPKLYAGGKATTVLTKVDKKSTITSVTSSKKDVATITKAGKLTPIKKGTTKLTIKVKSSNGTTKTYTKSYTVMADGVKTLTIKTNPTKMVYQVGDEFDKTGLTLDALYKSGKKSVIAASKVTVSGFDSSKAGTSTVKLSYAGKSLSLKVTVTEKEVVTVTGIAVTGMPQSVEVGSDWAEAKKAIKVVEAMSDGTEGKEVTAESTISDVDTSKEGEQEVTVTYKEFSTTATVKVVAKAVVEDTVEEKVAAYEKATAATYLEYAASTKAKAEATEAIATVEDEAKKAELTARVDKKSEEIEAAIKVYVDAVNTANTQAKLLAALNAFFDDASEEVIVRYAEVFIGGSELTVDEIQKHVYEQNFLAKFSLAIVGGEVKVNQLKLRTALLYGQEKGVLVGVNLENYFDAYVKIAESYAAPTDYETVDAIQTSMIDGCIITLVNDTDAAVKAAMDTPSDDELIKAAKELVETVPRDVKILKEMAINTGLKVDDNAYEKYSEILGQLIAVNGVVKTISGGTTNQAKLLEALKDEHFARVYADYVVAYLTDASYKLDGTEKTVEAIQSKLDGVNDNQATALVQAAEKNTTKETVEKAQEAVDRVQDDYEATESKVARTTKAALQKRVDAAKSKIATDLALAKINAFKNNGPGDKTSTTEVKNALKELGAAEAVKEVPGFYYETVDTSNIAAIEAVRDEIIAKKTAKDLDVAGVKAAVESAAVKTIQDWKKDDAALADSTRTTQLSTVKSNLATLAKAVSKDTKPAFTMEIVNESDVTLTQIRDDIFKATDSDNATTDTTAEIAGLVVKAAYNQLKALDSGNGADLTAAEAGIKDALMAIAKTESVKEEPAFTMKCVNLTVKALKDIAKHVNGTVTDSDINDTDATTIQKIVEDAALKAIATWTKGTPGAGPDNGTTEPTVKADLMTLSVACYNEDVTKKKFDYSSVDEKYLKTIRDLIVDDPASTADPATVQATVQKAYFDVLNKLNANSSQTEITDILTTIGRLPNFDVKTVRVEVYADYVEAIVKAQTGGVPNATALQNIVDEANALYDVNNAKTVDDMKNALAVVAINKSGTDYINKSEEAKTELAELFMLQDTFTAAGYVPNRTNYANGKYEATADVKTDVSALITAVNGLVSDVNAGCIADIDTTVTALKAIKYAKYEELSSQKKLLVAEKVIKAYPTYVDPTDGKTKPVQDSFKTLTEIKAAIDAAIATL